MLGEPWRMAPRHNMIWAWLALLLVAGVSLATEKDSTTVNDANNEKVDLEHGLGSAERARRHAQSYSHGSLSNIQIGTPAIPIHSSSIHGSHPHTPWNSHQSGGNRGSPHRSNTDHLTSSPDTYNPPSRHPHTPWNSHQSEGNRGSPQRANTYHLTSSPDSYNPPNRNTYKSSRRYKTSNNPHRHQPVSHAQSFQGIVMPSYYKTPTLSSYKPPQSYHQPSDNYGPPVLCPNGQECLPLVWCAPCYTEIKDNPHVSCSLHGGATGVCCPEQLNARERSQVFREPDLDVDEMSFADDVIEEAGRAAMWQLVERDLLENVLIERGIAVTDPRRPEFGHLQFFKTTIRAARIARDGLTGAGAGDYLLTRFRLNRLQASFGLRQISLADTIIADTCPRIPYCGEKERFYRTIDGSCNNLDNPEWGLARTPFQRILPPQYSDGLMRPRESILGGPLPSARVVSVSVVPDVNNPEPDLTLSVMQWAQFIDHDLTQTPIFRFGNNSGIECCANEGRDVIDESLLHPSCFPINIPADDPFYSRLGRRCMNFVRSMIAPRTPCTLGFAEQMNQLTHHLDGSNIYGSSRGEEQLLRTFRGGLMRMQRNGLLPPDFDALECESIKIGLPCFRAGDNRVNEQISLTAIQTIWPRLHNIIASSLDAQNPGWSDESLFQETRRIVVAIYQHIIYNEWLPIILGKDYMASRGLLPQREGFSDDYDESVNPTILNEFATVAYRFGHTMVQGMIDLVGKKGRRKESVLLRTQFNDPRLIYTPGRLDQFLRGLATQRPQMVDNFVTAELTNRLFETEEMPFGMDLVALNIQRGRDHAIAPYNDLRAACGLPKADNFQDLLDVLPTEVVAAFERIYASVDDIDPFVAGIAERHAPGSIMGPTFRCIIGDQFTRLRRGDRFFYSLGGQPTSFTEAQLHEIRKMSWARVLCMTGDNIMYVQPLAFLQPRGLNKRVTCDSPAIPQLDLTPWTSRTKN